MKKIYLILILGFILRLLLLGNQSIWLDEAFSIYHSQKPAYEILALDDPSPPLYHLILHNWTGIFGISEFSVRFPSLIFGVISIYLIYLLGRRMHKEKAGLFAALILAVSPINVFYSQEARAYSLLFMLSLASMYFYMKKKNKWYVLFSTLMIYTHIFGFLILIVQGIHAIWRKDIKRIAIPFISVLVLFTPWFLRLPSIIAEGHTTWIPFPKPYFIAIMGYNLVSGLIITLTGFILIILAAIMLFRRQKILPSLWLIVPIAVPLIFSLFFTPIFYPRYVMFVSLPLILMLARAQKKLVYAFVIISFITLCIQQASIVKEPWRDVAIEVQGTVGIVMEYEAQPLMYYLDRSCFYEDVFECARKNGIYPVKTFEGMKKFDTVIYSRMKHHEDSELFMDHVKDMDAQHFYYITPQADVRALFGDAYDEYAKISVYK